MGGKCRRDLPCNKCGVNERVGGRSWCSSCSNEYLRKWWKSKDYKKRKSNNLKGAYGISFEDYENLFNKQDGKCLICEKELFIGESNSRDKAVIDHCHNSNKIRGILCYNCNTGLGMFGDNVDNLQKAIEYLENENS